MASPQGLSTPWLNLSSLITPANARGRLWRGGRLRRHWIVKNVQRFSKCHLIIIHFVHSTRTLKDCLKRRRLQMSPSQIPAKTQVLKPWLGNCGHGYISEPTVRANGHGPTAIHLLSFWKESHTQVPTCGGESEGLYILIQKWLHVKMYKVRSFPSEYRCKEESSGVFPRHTPSLPSSIATCCSNPGHRGRFQPDS